MTRVLITGGAGFIGSNFVRYALRQHPDWHVAVCDLLTYAGNLQNLSDVLDSPRVSFVRADIADRPLMEALLGERFDIVVNFAAETHVDRSILSPEAFVRTDVLGVFALLEAARRHSVRRFVQVSTDEVYGSVAEGACREEAPLAPTSPYAASKTGADRLAYAYFATYGLPVLIVRPSNTFGPYQHPEKLIPLFVTNALLGVPLPVYGDGRNVRDWLYVEDHCAALDVVLERGKPGEVYNIGAGNERTNLQVTEAILRHLGRPLSLVRYVRDRPGHDRRYRVDSSKLRSLGWEPRWRFEAALSETIDWYVSHPGWWRGLRGGEFSEYYSEQYGDGQAGSRGAAGATERDGGRPEKGEAPPSGRLE